MAREDEKILEAEFFLDKMREAQRLCSLRQMAFYASAFLSAARSVLQYSHEEAFPLRHEGNNDKSTKDDKVEPTPAQIWYTNTVGIDKRRKFLKKLRDKNVHVELHKPSMGVTVHAPTAIGGSFSVSDRTSEVKRKMEKLSHRVSSKTTFFMSGWNDEDIIDFSQEMIKSIRCFVREGEQKGFIHPESTEQFKSISEEPDTPCAICQKTPGWNGRSTVIDSDGASQTICPECVKWLADNGFLWRERDSENGRDTVFIRGIKRMSTSPNMWSVEPETPIE